MVQVRRRDPRRHVGVPDLYGDGHHVAADVGHPRPLVPSEPRAISAARTNLRRSHAQPEPSPGVLACPLASCLRSVDAPARRAEGREPSAIPLLCRSHLLLPPPPSPPPPPISVVTQRSTSARLRAWCLSRANADGFDRASRGTSGSRRVVSVPVTVGSPPRTAVASCGSGCRVRPGARMSRV